MSNISLENKVNSKTKILELVKVSDYSSPKQLIEAKINSGIKNFFQDLFSDTQLEQVYHPYDTLNAFSTDQINKIAPRPDWNQIISNLNESISDELKSSEKVKYVFINKPNSGTEDIIRKFLHNQNFAIQDPPSYEEILQYEEGDSIDIDLDRNIAILDLENWFLRYFSGLDFIEKVIEMIENHPYSVIIVCHSWTWNFLTEVLKISTSQYKIRIFQSLDHQRLGKWLLNLTRKTKNRKLLYRMADTGKLVTKDQIDVANSLKEKINSETNALEDIIFDADEKYMKKLAGYSLGLPITCWHIWRHSLRRDLDDEFQIDTKGEEKLDPYTIWVLPWEKISLPSLSKKIKTDEKMILYTIILHNGLPLDIIHKILDLEIYHLISHIESLTKSGVIYQSGDHYFVSSNVYPKVRRILEGTGFLVDDMEGA